MSLQLSRGFALLLGLLPLTFLAHCGGGESGTGRADYNASLPGAGAEVIRTGIPDPGPTEDNCSMRDAFEISVQHDFEGTFVDNCPTSATYMQTRYAAPTWFIFSDGTTPFLRPLAVENRAPESTPPNTGWGLDAFPAANLPGGAPCGSNGVLRLYGGPFEMWGGGIGSGYFNGQVELGPKDFSAYEGISFWARRGPEGQSTLRISLIDEQISETFARGFYIGGMEPPFCQIAMRCDCINGKPCTFYEPLNASYCWDPAVDPPPDEPQPDFLGCQMQNADGTLTPVLRTDTRVMPKTCGDTFCQAPRVDTEGANVGSVCTERLFENNLTGNFCGNPDQHIPEPTERCGNAYSQIVQVGPEWQLYTIPFEELVQADYAYRGAALEPDKLYSIGFGWIGGWVDFYIDDVGFYRRL